MHNFGKEMFGVALRHQCRSIWGKMMTILISYRQKDDLTCMSCLTPPDVREHFLAPISSAEILLPHFLRVG